LARNTGKTVRAIHLYEELGLLSPATRSSGGFRLYEPRAIERVRWIDMLHGLGFSLHEMRDVLQGWWSSELGPEAMQRLRTLFQRKLEETRAAIDRHRQLEAELTQGLAYLETCKVCPTHESVRGCVTCSHDHGMEHEPALLAGITWAAENATKTRERAKGLRPIEAGFVPLERVEGREPPERGTPRPRLLGKELDSR